MGGNDASVEILCVGPMAAARDEMRCHLQSCGLGIMLFCCVLGFLVPHGRAGEKGESDGFCPRL